VTPSVQRRRRHESGSTMIEFAFVILPLMGFLLMTMDVAWILFGWASIQEGAREGVRYAISCQVSSGLNASIKSVVQQYSAGFAKPANVTIKYCSATDVATPCTALTGVVTAGQVVNVTVGNVSVGTFGPIFRTWTPISLSASSADIMETCNATQ
jgi:Flp pilus assembly protein TadG